MASGGSGAQRSLSRGEARRVGERRAGEGVAGWWGFIWGQTKLVKAAWLVKGSAATLSGCRVVLEQRARGAQRSQCELRKGGEQLRGLLGCAGAGAPTISSEDPD